MAKTESIMLPLGTIAPDFTLTDVVTNKLVSLSTMKSPLGTVIMFICNHCPFVKLIQDELVAVANHYQPKGISFIAISANDAINYPDDSPDNMKEIAIAHHYPFPYLYDETQSIAKAYQAACTPDFFLFDDSLKCVYRGRLDDATPGNGIPVTGKDLRAALDALIDNRPIPKEQHPSVGCGIKWKQE